MTAEPALAKPYPYEDQEPRYRCRTCGDPADRLHGWAPLFESGRWTDHGAPYCEEHLKAANDKALSLRLAKFEEGFFRMRYWTIDTFPADDEAGQAAKATALAWHEELAGECNVYIYGGVGSGKSGLAWGLARLDAENPWNESRFVNVRQLLARIRRSFGDREAHDPFDELAKEVGTLVLDDLGAERVTDWTREWLATLIEERYVGERMTIVTSNYSPSQLARRLGHDDPIIGKRIVSRLTENAVIIKLDRRDLRLRGE